MQTLEKILRKKLFWFFYFPVISFIIAFLYFQSLKGTFPSTPFNPQASFIDIIGYLGGGLLVFLLIYAAFWPTGWMGYFDLLGGLPWIIYILQVVFFYAGYTIFALKARSLKRVYLFIIAAALIIFTGLSIHGCTNNTINSLG